ncbi:MAG TPA: hypothetical protein VFB67_07760 [Candidatus Polarisedimenticolaceae bacterium]|nr:hypothetical protein [Candidatus Polarisedimenticolaceae bacterium]
MTDESTPITRKELYRYLSSTYLWIMIAMVAAVEGKPWVFWLTFIGITTIGVVFSLKASRPDEPLLARFLK